MTQSGEMKTLLISSFCNFQKRGGRGVTSDSKWGAENTFAQ